LATVVANAEFLYEADELKLKKSEIYEEIKTAANQMTDLIDSLRELSSQRTAISPARADLAVVIRRAAETIRARPEFRNTQVVLVAQDQLHGVFDPGKLERVFFNLILNACEAAGTGCSVAMDARKTDEAFEIRISDHGPGIAPNIRDTLFNPFVSFGKPHGTGMGLAIVTKIVQDHGGSVSVESTSASGTVVLVKLPRSLKAISESVKPAIA
jgi:signal transduction histidine kinase